MNRATRQMRAFAECIMVLEAENHDSPAGTTPVAIQIVDMLQPHLAMLMGNGGFRALLSRALALAKVEASGLDAVHVTTNGALDGLEVARSQLPPAEFDEGSVVLIAQLLGLLVAFIGAGLTLRLMGKIWPGIACSGLDLDAEEINERAS